MRLKSYTACRVVAAGILACLTLSATANASYVDAVLADNPVGYWRFEEASGTTASDSSGNGRHGAYDGGFAFGSSGALSIGGTSVSLNGTSGRVILPGTWGGPGWTELTIEAWVNTAEPITSNFQSIVAGHSNNNFAHFHLHNVGNIGVYTNAGFVSTPIVPATPTGAWRHVVLTSKSGDTRVFVDGAQVGGTNPTAFSSIGMIDGTNGILTIGQGHVGTRWFHGLIDEVAIYNTALPSERVLAHFTAAGAEPPPPPPPPPPAALLAHWKFDTDASDATGNHPGTLQGGASVTGDARVGGGALDLRGVNGSVSIPTSVLGGEPNFSIAMFVSVDSLTHGCCSALLTTPGWMLDSLHLNIATANGVPELAVNGNAVGAWGRDPNGPVPADGSWVHLAYTYDGNQGVVTPYINGVAGTPTFGTLRPTAGGGPLTIGMWSDDRFLDGRIDDLRIYSGVLSPETIAQLAAIPEPSSLLLLAAGLAAMVAGRRARRAR